MFDGARARSLRTTSACADRSRPDRCFDVAEQSSEEAGPADFRARPTREPQRASRAGPRFVQSKRGLLADAAELCAFVRGMARATGCCARDCRRLAGGAALELRAVWRSERGLERGLVATPEPIKDTVDAPCGVCGAAVALAYQPAQWRQSWRPAKRTRHGTATTSTPAVSAPTTRSTAAAIR